MMLMRRSSAASRARGAMPFSISRPHHAQLKHSGCPMVKALYRDSWRCDTRKVSEKILLWNQGSQRLQVLDEEQGTSNGKSRVQAPRRCAADSLDSKT